MSAPMPPQLTSTVSLKSVPRHRDMLPERSILRRGSVSQTAPPPQSTAGSASGMATSVSSDSGDPWRYAAPNMNPFPPPSSSSSSTSTHAPFYPPFVPAPRRSMSETGTAMPQAPPPTRAKVQVHPYLRPPSLSAHRERFVWDMHSSPQNASLFVPGIMQVPFCTPQNLNTVVTHPSFGCLRLGVMLHTSSTTPLRNRRGGRIRGWQISVQASNPRLGVTFQDLLAAIWRFMQEPAPIQTPTNPYAAPAQTRKKSDCLAGCTTFAGLVDDAEFARNEDDEDDYIPGMMTLLCGLPQA